MASKKPRRAKRKPAAPDAASIAAAVEPTSLPRQAVLQHLLEGAFAEIARLVELGAELGATESRALCEHRRLVARLCGVLGTGSSPRVVAVSQYADLPMFTDSEHYTPSPTIVGPPGDAADDLAEPEADDADIDAKLAQTFNAEVSDATDE